MKVNVANSKSLLYFNYYYKLPNCSWNVAEWLALMIGLMLDSQKILYQIRVVKKYQKEVNVTQIRFIYI